MPNIIIQNIDRLSKGNAERIFIRKNINVFKFFREIEFNIYF